MYCMYSELMATFVTSGSPYFRRACQCAFPHPGQQDRFGTSRLRGWPPLPARTLWDLRKGGLTPSFFLRLNLQYLSTVSVDEGGQQAECETDRAVHVFRGAQDGIWRRYFHLIFTCIIYRSLIFFRLQVARTVSLNRFSELWSEHRISSDYS